VTIYKRGTANELKLGENNVGKATSTAIYPGIQQCFAVAGLKHNAILGAHVTPFTTAEDLDAIFAELGKLGGTEIEHWYVIGPFDDHFAISKAQWRCENDIKQTFRSSFPKNGSATHWILDCSTERHGLREVDQWGDGGVTKVMAPMVGIDIKLVVRGNDRAFSYKDKSPTQQTWTGFDFRKFHIL
jgi:hypothetical protein